MMPPTVIYIMGVAGSGKTTIGQQLSAATGIPFFDGDNFHTVSNKEKMKAGQPLNDEDRKDWLLRLHQLAKDEVQKNGAIIACSALKQHYRELLSAGLDRRVHWVLLQGDYALISERMRKRKDHFMPVDLLQSQFDVLEVPENALVIDIGLSPDAIVKLISEKLLLK
ncbi:MAG: gluconokinase [Chitinophagaceae bacterium]|nr:gluconokinase [Chitinophagaceae bacterium]